jgi:hypothetical protein
MFSIYPQVLTLTYPITLTLYSLIRHDFLRLICPCSISTNQDSAYHQINTNCTWSCPRLCQLPPTRPLPTKVAIFTTVTPLLEDFLRLVLLPGTDCGVALPRPADPEPRDTDAYILKAR